MKETSKKTGTRVLGIMLLFILTMCISGCKSGAKEADIENMGRYVEEKVELPQELTDNEETLGFLLQSPDGERVIYSCGESEDGLYTMYYQYTYENGEWVREEPTWTQEDMIKNNYIQQMKYGGDGKLYILVVEMSGTNNDILYHIMRLEDEKMELVPIDDLQVKNENGTYKNVNNFEVLQNGNIILQEYSNTTYKAYKNEGGECLYEFEAGENAWFTSNSQNIITMNEDLTAISLLDSETGAKKQEIPVTFDSNVSNSCFALTATEDTVYMVTNSGLYAIGLNGSITTALIEGSAGSMSTPNIQNMMIIQDEESNLYVMYSTFQGPLLVEYEFKDDIVCDPDKVFTVYSLEQNTLVQQACIYFQREHPEINVDYRIAKNNDSSLTMADYIKAFNTEILADNGADVIICDGLPSEDYIEKGIFMDMSDVIEPFTEEGQLFENVVDAYRKDGGIYTLPMKYLPCFYIGTAEAIEATSSFEEFCKYANGQSVFGSNMSPDCLFDCFYQQNYETLQDEDGLLIRDKFTDFLNQLKDMNHFDSVSSGDEDNWSAGKYLDLLQNKITLFNDTITSQVYLLFADKTLEDDNNVLSSAGNRFIANCQVGINSATKNEVLAKEFVGYMLDPELQSGIYGDGVPLNKAAYYSGWSDKKIYGNIGAGLGDPSTGYQFEIEEPAKEETLNRYQAIIEGANKPVDYNETIYQMIKEHLTDFFNGDISAEELVDEVNSKASIYLKE